MKPKIDRNLWLLYAAFLVVGVNAAIPMVFGAFYIQAHDPTSRFKVALILALPALLAFLGQNLWGGLFDLSGRYRPFLILAFAAQAICFGLLAMVDSPGYFIVVLCAATFFSVAVIPVAQAYATLSYESTKGLVLGRLFAFESLGWGLGCLTGLMFKDGLSDLVVLNRIFLTQLLLAAAVAAILGVLFKAGRPVVRSRGTGITLGGLVAEALGLYRDRKIAALSMVIFCQTVSNCVFFTFYSLYLCDHLAGSKALLGVSLAGATILGAVSFPIHGRISDRIGRGPLIVVATLSYLPLYFAFIFIKNPLVTAILYCLPLYPAVRVATNAFLADLTDSDVRGGGIGLIEGVQAMGSFVGALGGALVVFLFGLEMLPHAAFVCMLLTSGVIAWVHHAEAML